MTKDKFTRSFYIVLVPVILVVILINSGFLQARVPAVSVGDQGFNVARFNFYYFTAYNDFVEENFDAEGNGPFDESTALRDQEKSEGLTWKEYFQEIAQQRLQEVCYFYDLAQKTGYEFSEAEIQPVQDQMDLIEQDRTENGISLENYLVAYWGVGMTESIYREELTRSVQADAYRSYLIETAQVAEESLKAWVQENHPESYASANLRMIVLEAAEDRFTGEVGKQQLEDLQAKLERLQARYEDAPECFDELVKAFCEDPELSASGGICLNATKDLLPESIAAWVFSEERQPGDTTALVAENSAYLVIYDGQGEDAAVITATKTLQDQQVTEACQQAAPEITHNALGWRLVGR
jgi:hypothetical protein